MQQAAPCEIDNCGVQAIGRCLTCGKSFCLSHQARDTIDTYGGRAYADQCAPCFAKTLGQKKKAENDAHLERLRASNEFFDTKAAPDTLRASGTKLVKLYEVSETYKQGGLFSKSDWLEKASLKGEGWVIGEFDWVFDEALPPYDSVNYHTRKMLTAVSDSGRLYPVKHYKDGYRVVNNGTFKDHIAAEGAVKKAARDSAGA
jgi:hypothetical protein